MIFYLMLRMLHGRVWGAAGASILLGSTHLLFFGRGETLPTWTIFFTSLCLALTTLAERRPSPLLLGGIACLFGFGLQFSGSGRLVLGLTLVFSACICLHRELYRSDRSISKIALLPVMASVGIVVGTGPLWLVTSLSTIGGQGKFVSLPQGLAASLTFITPRYWELVKTLWDAAMPIYDSPLLGKAMIGASILEAIRLPRSVSSYLAILLLALIPLTNGALTNAYFPSRLVAMAVVGPFVLVSVLHWLCSKIKVWRWSQLLEGLICGGLVLTSSVSIFAFFNDEIASYPGPGDNVGADRHFALRYAMVEIEKLRRAGQGDKYCLAADKDFSDYLKAPHIGEHFQFLMPGTIISIAFDPNLTGSSLAVRRDCSDIEKVLERVYCKEYQKFICPRDGKPVIVFIPSGSRTPIGSQERASSPAVKEQDLAGHKPFF